MRQPRSIPVGGVRGREEGCERLLPRAAAPVRYVVYSAPSSALLRVRLVNENGKCSVPHTRYYRVRTTVYIIDARSGQGGLGGGLPKGRTASPATYLPANCNHDQSLLFSQPRRDRRPVGDVEAAVVSRGGHGLSREPRQAACCAQPRRRWLSFSSRIQACHALTQTSSATPRDAHRPAKISPLPFASLNL